MRTGRMVFASAPILAIVLLACGSPSAPGQQPPGYIEVPGSPDVLLNPAHQGAVGSEFSQQCIDANPDPPGPGEVGWHFILPQSVEEFQRGASPGNIFQTLRVTFATAGPVTLTVFGPPSDAHAYFTTPTDDVLVSGNADIYRELNLQRGNEPFFNLSHTCAPPGQPTTTSSSTTTSTSTTTTTTTEPSTTTSTTSTTTTSTTTEPTTTTSTTTTTEPTTTTTSTSTSTTSTTQPSASTTTIESTSTTTAPTSTTDPTAVTTSTTPTTLGPSTSISGGGGSNTTTTSDPGGTGGTTTLPAIPVTGSSDRRLSLAALFALSLGIVLVVVTR